MSNNCSPQVINHLLYAKGGREKSLPLLMLKNCEIHFNQLCFEIDRLLKIH